MLYIPLCTTGQRDSISNGYASIYWLVTTFTASPFCAADAN
jgi:hypothetical protein